MAACKMSDGLLARWQHLVHERLGFVLPSAQQGWLTNAVHKSATAKNLTENALYELVSCDESEFWWFAEVLLITETRFFRDESGISYITERYTKYVQECPQEAIIAPFVVISAGCSTGQEAWSLALALHRAYKQPCYKIIGIDASLRAIRQANQGAYLEWDYQSHADYNDMVDLCAQGVRISDKIRPQVAFYHGNLIADPLIAALQDQGLQYADMIICQNVLIYFDKLSQDQVLADFAKCLRPGGQMLIGSGEALFWVHDDMQKIRHPQVNVWQRRA